jgi:hypothetical protein
MCSSMISQSTDHELRMKHEFVRIRNISARSTYHCTLYNMTFCMPCHNSSMPRVVMLSMYAHEEIFAD